VSLSRSYQGAEGTCFAHTASLVIFHNLYGISLEEEDKQLYIENNCNLHLNTQKELEDYEFLRTNCGESGANRILLFLYIYRVLTNKFGCDGGTLPECFVYFLNTPFHNIFNRKINTILLPIYKSVDKELFDVSFLTIDDFSPEYKDYLSIYFDDYYGGLSLKTMKSGESGHAITMVSINQYGILCKDSANKSIYLIPFNEFKVNGILHTKSRIYNLRTLYFLYKKTDSEKYNTIFELKQLKSPYKYSLLDFPKIKDDIDEEYKVEREKAVERRTKKINQELRLEKMISDSLKRGGKRTRRNYKRSKHHVNFT
jgi:hypothetical protein